MTDDLPRPNDTIAQIVVVCHANIARSPLGMVLFEREARDRFGDEPPVWVRSAGVRAIEGAPAAHASIVQARHRGLDLTAHRASQLHRHDVADADLVVTMTESQRDVAVRMVPAASRWTFTLAELARLSASIQDVGDPTLSVRGRLRFVVRLAHGARPYVARPAAPEDVGDPFGGPEIGYVRMADEVEALVGSVSAVVFGGPHTSAGPQQGAR